MKKLFEHQRKGVDLFKLSHEFYCNFCDPGTGKTLMAIQAIAELDLPNALIVCPKSLIQNWINEFAEWAPQYHCFGYTGTASGKAKALKAWFACKEKRVLIINYESLITKGVAPIFGGRWQLIVYDEAHKTKGYYHKKSKQGKAAKRLKTMRTWMMTGTPTPNNPLEVFSLFDIGKPGYLGANYYSFRAEYAITTKKNGFTQVLSYQNLPKLQQLVARYSYRVTKDECLDLPPQIFQVIPIDMEPAARKVYDTLAEELVVDLFGDGETVVATPNILTKMMKLQQLTSGFLIDEDGTLHRAGKDKQAALADLIDSFDPKESVVIWCKFTHEIDVVREILEAAGRKIWEISGRIKSEDRAIAVKEFQEGEPSVMVANMAAGGVGITLTRSNTVIYYSRSFNAVDSMQSVDRTYRIGQTRKVTYYDLVCRKTLDQYIINALKKKKQLADKMTGDDVRAMLRGEG